MPDLPTGTVTMLFTDIEGSTRLLQQVGEYYAEVVATYRQLLRAIFHHWHGHELDTQGDAFFLVFARATDAISAAVEMQCTLATHAWPKGVNVRVRIGLHTGEPRLSTEGYIGLDVHHAARIMSAGHGGQVLFSAATQELVKRDLPDGVSLRDLGEYRLKDLQYPSRLFQLVIADLPADFPPLKTLDSHPNNLPIQPTALIGREKEMTAIERLLRREDVRLVTLTGPGGIGKTRLGLQVAAELSDRFPDGVFFVNLAPLSDPALVIPTIAQTLDVQEITTQSLLDLLKTYLREKHLLLLLDNFEQVAYAAPQVADLLATCPKLKLMVTSRAVLHVRGEQEFAVPPLSLPDPKHLPDLVVLPQYEAVALFIVRAQAVKPEFQVTNANAAAVAEICVRLDGLPLAIELAVARIKLLPPQALLARLSNRLAVLTSGARDVPARQQTLRDTIEWSYHLLDIQQQRLFRLLSVFVGGCTLQAIESVYAALNDGAGQVLEGVASLVDKSLLQQTEQETEEPRLLMLETIREYGLEALAANGEMEGGRRAHAAYYLALAEEAEPELEGPQQVIWLERLEREYDNLRAAMQWLLEQERAGQRKEMALRLGAALRQFWMVRGPYSEGRNVLERALATSEGVAAFARANALNAAGSLALAQADIDRAKVRCEESLVLFKELGDKRGIAYSLYCLGWVAGEQGNLSTARSLIEEALVLFREAGVRERVAWSLRTLGELDNWKGEYTRACALCEESLALFRKLGNKLGMAASLFSLALIFFVSQGDPARARSLLEEVLTLSRELGDKETIASSLIFSGELALSEGDASVARSLAEEALALFRQLGIPWGLVEALRLLARVEARQSNHAVARALYEECLVVARESNYKRQVTSSLEILVGLISPQVASSLEGLAGLIAAQGEPAWAARLWGAAESLREAIGMPLPPVYRADYERSVTSARAQLGEKAFVVAWEEGRTMTAEQALAAQGRTTASTATIPPTALSAPSSKSPTTYPAGLTAREVEVLRLVAQGLTDAQVAEELVISPRTVNTHLKSIYGMIQVTSRSAATRYAIEHQLL